MSHNKYASPLRIEIKSSPSLLAIVLVVHIGAIAMLAISEMTWILKIILVFIVAASLLLYTGFYLFFYKKSSRVHFMDKLFPRIRCLVWDKDDRWILAAENGEEIQAHLVAGSFVHPQLTTVNLRLMGKPWYNRYRSFVFMQDNLNAEVFRRLRVRLRWYSTPDQDSLGALK
ncbi:protein YgfX [Kaarinaea lacus]